MYFINQNVILMRLLNLYNIFEVQFTCMCDSKLFQHPQHVLTLLFMAYSNTVIIKLV